MYNKECRPYIIQRVKQWNCKKRRNIKPQTKSSNNAMTINRDPRIQNKMNQEREQNHGIE